MKNLILTLVLFLNINSLFSQYRDNGIGGYGYLQMNIMHNTKSKSNWIYGGGGLIVNRVYFAGLYYGSMINNYNSLDLSDPELFNFSSAMKDSSNFAFTNINNSDIGVEVGAVLLAEKPIQFSFSLKSGAMLSNYVERVLDSNSFSILEGKRTDKTKPFFTISPEIKACLMPNHIFKLQVGVGYKYVYYDNGLLKEEIYNGSRKSLFNSFYWNFSVIFGSF